MAKSASWKLRSLVLQEQGKPKIIGIVGVGGIGKTTLAKKFFNHIRSNYAESSFLQDVREICAKNSLNYMQNELIKDLKLGNIVTECIEEPIGMLKRHQLSCHALIVLDDVSDAHQLEVLLSIKKDLTPESLILVTSRDKHVLTSTGVLESSLYNLKGLNFPQSKQLFCSYAFHHPLPQSEFADLVDRFVRACNGLPLSLKVIGALVHGENERYWTEQLDRLQHTLPMEIEGSLRISYDSLTKEDQVIFVDIACFFIGEDRDKAIRIWSEVGIQNLDNENKINTHSICLSVIVLQFIVASLLSDDSLSVLVAIMLLHLLLFLPSQWGDNKLYVPIDMVLEIMFITCIVIVGILFFSLFFHWPINLPLVLLVCGVVLIFVHVDRVDPVHRPYCTITDFIASRYNI